MTSVCFCVLGQRARCQTLTQQHSCRQRHKDGGNDTLAPSLSFQWPYEALQGFTGWQSARLSHSRCLHGDPIDSQCITDIMALYPHMCDSYIFVGYTHTHTHTQTYPPTWAHTHNQKKVCREVVKFSALVISHPCCEQLWCRSAGNLQEKKLFKDLKCRVSAAPH